MAEPTASNAAQAPGAPDRGSALRLRGLVVSYPNGVKAIDSVDLDVAVGASTAVIGPSGSGKSSLLNGIAGLAPVAGGVIEVDGHPIDLTDEGRRRRYRRTAIGMVFQDGQLLPELNAVHNVALPLRLMGHGKRDALASARRCLDELGLGAEADRPLRELSGGQIQRIAVARAVVHSPHLVLADEPTGALDSANRDLVLSLLLDATTGRGRTLIMVTHDLELAGRCDRIVKLLDGRIDESC